MTRTQSRSLTALIAAMVLGTLATTAQAAPTAKESALAYVKGVYEVMDRTATTSADLDALHKAIGEQMRTFMDYTEMSTRTLGDKQWAGLTPAQRAEFTSLLEAMVQRTYVKRFKPGRAVKITYDPKVRVRKDGRAQVRTTLHVGRTSADVNYSMLPAEGSWKVYDIVVDDASQVHVYRQSFSKILKREGWDGLMKRMRKSAKTGE